MIYCRCSIHKHIVQNKSTRGKTKIILLTLEMARQEVSRTTHIEEGELRVTHENAILTNITGIPCPHMLTQPTSRIITQSSKFKAHIEIRIFSPMCWLVFGPGNKRSDSSPGLEARISSHTFHKCSRPRFHRELSSNAS